MVPLADIFNHKAAVVSLAGDYQIDPNCFGEDSASQSSEAASSSGAVLCCTSGQQHTCCLRNLSPI